MILSVGLLSTVAVGDCCKAVCGLDIRATNVVIFFCDALYPFILECFSNLRGLVRLKDSMNKLYKCLAQHMERNLRKLYRLDLCCIRTYQELIV